MISAARASRTAESSARRWVAAESVAMAATSSAAPVRLLAGPIGDGAGRAGRPADHAAPAPPIASPALRETAGGQLGAGRAFLGGQGGLALVLLDLAEDGPHLDRRLARLLGEVAHLHGDGGEAAAMLAGLGGLDGGVEREQVGLLGEVLHRGDDLTDLQRPLGEIAHGRGDAADLLAQCPGRAPRLLDGAQPLAGEGLGALGHHDDRLGLPGRLAGDVGDGRGRGGGPAQGLGLAGGGVTLAGKAAEEAAALLAEPGHGGAQVVEHAADDRAEIIQLTGQRPHLPVGLGQVDRRWHPAAGQRRGDLADARERVEQGARQPEGQRPAQDGRQERHGGQPRHLRAGVFGVEREHGDPLDRVGGEEQRAGQPGKPPSHPRPGAWSVAERESGTGGHGPFYQALARGVE